MGFQWLDVRVGEEKDRRRREAEVIERLPRALEELHGALEDCIRCYAAEFGAEAAEIHRLASNIQVTVREDRDGRWQPRARIEIGAVAALPGFQIERDGETFRIEIGMLPGDKLFYKQDEDYLSIEDVTRRILDRALFPKLGE
jgi:hypothetical protein